MREKLNLLIAMYCMYIYVYLHICYYFGEGFL